MTDKVLITETNTRNHLNPPRSRATSKRANLFTPPYIIDARTTFLNPSVSGIYSSFSKERTTKGNPSTNKPLSPRANAKETKKKEKEKYILLNGH